MRRQRRSLKRPRSAITAKATSAAAAPAGATSPPATSPPATDPADIGRRSLPVYLTRFFGRDADGARLRAEVLGQRLVTLLGPGGGGKTRLAVELAAALRDARDTPFDFVAFIPLVACSTRAQVLDALLAGLHLAQHAADPFEALIAALAGRRALLVLDNFEQLGGLAEDVVARLAQSIPTLHLLVTSRRVLGLDGEREFAIQPLALPRAGLALGEAAINPAVALFVDRARAVRADFHIGPSNLAAVHELVHLLEGMPLAIELAAARVRSIAPAPMAELLRAARIRPDGRALELLNRTGPRGGTDLRHASMLRVIEWSWRLLDPPQARLLAALTVFQGGCTAAAAQAVCGALAEHASVRLDELVGHSLLRVVDNAGQATRYATFEPVREYAALQLDAARAAELRERHRAWLIDWARTLPPTPSLAEVRSEQPNLLAALAGVLADTESGAEPEDAIRLLLPLRRVLEDVELPAEGLHSLAAALERCTDAALCSQGHTLLAPLLYVAGRRIEAENHAARGLHGAPPGTPWRGRALHAAARVRWRSTRRADGVLEPLDEAEALAVAARDDELLASICALRAFVINHQPDRSQAVPLHRRALALWERLGNQHAINSGRYNLAVSAQNDGRHEETLARLAELEPSARALQDWRRLSQLMNVRGNALSELRRWDEAVACFQECNRLAWDCLALHELAFGLWNLPRALVHVGRAERALQLAGFAEAFWQDRFGQLGPTDRRDLERVRRLAARRVPPPRAATLWAQGAALALAEAVALALQGAA